MRKMRPSVIRMIILAAVLCCFFHAAGADTWYVENEWNYLDAAMDPDHGIPEDANGALARIRRTGVLRVAVDFETAPMNFLDPEKNGDAQYAGLDMALAREIAKKMNVKLEIVPMKPTQKLLALLNDRCDLTISAITYTPARSLYYTLSNAYYYRENEEPDIGILIRADETIDSLKQLENKKIAAQSSSLQEAFASVNEDLKKSEVFYRTASARAVYDMVRNGEADAGIVSIETANAYFLHEPDCGMCLAEGLAFFPADQYRGYRVAANKGETELIAFVNGVINQARANDNELLKKWLEEARNRAKTLGLE